MTGGGGAHRQSAWSVDLGLALIALALALITSMVLTLPQASPAIVNDRLDILTVTAATLIAGAVAALDWSRGRVANDSAALLRSSAFAVLAVLNGLTLIATVFGADRALGATLADPGQLPLIANIVGRGVAAALLVAAGWMAVNRGLLTIRPAMVLLGPSAVVLAVLASGALAPHALPQLVPPAVLGGLAADPTAALDPGAAPILAVIQALIGAGFLAAGVLAHRAFRRSGRAADALLAAGLLVAAFSQVHSIIHPGSYSSVVTSADLLRVVFYGLLLFGVVAESRDDLADLRAATREVRRLAASEFVAAGLEERARLAREIHDGLAQDLWYAKLKQSRLAQMAGFSGEAQQLSNEVGTAIDDALAEARHAIAAMREGAESGSLLEMLSRHVEDFADRFALRAELTVDGPLPEISPRAQAEVLRITQEAMTNVRKHADATFVRVNLAATPDLCLTITDNGRGFLPDAVPAGFGLESMRQRAAVVGATLTVRSESQNGTRVVLVVPRTQRRETNGA